SGLAMMLCAALDAPAFARDPNGPPARVPQPDRSAVCGGETLPVVHLRDNDGAAPYVKLRAGGISGHFLIDWGATASSVAARRYPSARERLEARDFSLPSFASGTFMLRDYALSLEPPGGQLGIVGTDFLSLLAAHLVYGDRGTTLSLSSTPCRAEGLRAGGFRPISQKGFYSSDLSRIEKGRPNIPVLFLSLAGVVAPAQIDSGYEDITLRHSIDINTPMHRALIAAGVRFRELEAITIATCTGTEQRAVLVPEGAAVAITDERGARIRDLDGAHLILKAPGSCGGIAGMAEPAAQIGASTLRTLREIVIDGKSETVWIRAGQPAR
ncbi:MAG TPA: hypothetical protein PK264_07240, partial [Hyphomicrobiaceae bacterium]|nr:hypothetical protein [Hyphomicrobiaceae bacterium]